MFRATIQHGKLFFGPNRERQFEDWLSRHEGKSVLISPDKPKRSDNQNRYYWMYLTVIANDTGENENDLHEYFKRTLLSPVFKTVMGKDLKMPRSTRTLSRPEFAEYMKKICATTGISLPDPEAVGYITNYGLIRK